MVVDDTRGEQVELETWSTGRRFSGPNECGGQPEDDSTAGTFSLLAEADNVDAEVGRLGLLDVGNFDLTLEQWANFRQWKHWGQSNTRRKPADHESRARSALGH